MASPGRRECPVLGERVGPLNVCHDGCCSGGIVVISISGVEDCDGHACVLISTTNQTHGSMAAPVQVERAVWMCGKVAARHPPRAVRVTKNGVECQCWPCRAIEVPECLRR